jgi:hypothetical protein
MLRPEQDPEGRPGLVGGATRYITLVNCCEARCGMCGGRYFVNESVLAAILTSAEAGLDNPFRCAACEEEYDELAYDG